MLLIGLNSMGERKYGGLLGAIGRSDRRRNRRRWALGGVSDAQRIEDGCDERGKFSAEDNRYISDVERLLLHEIPKNGISIGFRAKQLPLVVKEYLGRSPARKVANKIGISHGYVLSLYVRLEKLVANFGGMDHILHLMKDRSRD